MRIFAGVRGREIDADSILCSRSKRLRGIFNPEARAVRNYITDDKRGSTRILIDEIVRIVCVFPIERVSQINLLCLELDIRFLGEGRNGCQEEDGKGKNMSKHARFHTTKIRKTIEKTKGAIRRPRPKATQYER